MRNKTEITANKALYQTIGARFIGFCQVHSNAKDILFCVVYHALVAGDFRLQPARNIFCFRKVLDERKEK